MSEASDTIAVIGDLHSAWSRRDVDYFESSTYPLLLVTGDLAGSEARDELSLTRSLAELSRSTLVMPGNNDADAYARIAAELTYRQGRQALLDGLVAPEHNHAGVANARGVRACGFSVHPLQLRALELSIIAGRPFAMGGDQFSYPEALERNFGVRSIAESTARLCELVDNAATEHLLFFAHNGPKGLGAERDALWGRDFDVAAGDWGDSDLRSAIDHALAIGKKPLAVVAGHMHWRLRGTGERRWQLQRDGILYVNAARVPRIVTSATEAAHHHIALKLTAAGASATEVAVTLPAA